MLKNLVNRGFPQQFNSNNWPALNHLRSPTNVENLRKRYVFATFAFLHQHCAIASHGIKSPLVRL